MPARLGLRRRTAAAFALGSAALSGTLALTTHEIVRTNLVRQRERIAVRETSLDARIAASVLDSPNPDVAALIAELSARDSLVLLSRDGPCSVNRSM